MILSSPLTYRLLQSFIYEDGTNNHGKNDDTTKS